MKASEYIGLAVYHTDTSDELLSAEGGIILYVLQRT